ncbi:cysteine proteinase [Lojkania enalia]|uniref:Cysteine proteinase n=1 Tax=Lojkania enalia TaxID=147567 RepID=A0A9P4N5H8_9PLEO|nr:cysteine proteinase [Didymosphaeria enalia]
MADSNAQRETFKAAASGYRSRFEEAVTKDEAITLAIKGVENFMSALELSRDPNEREDLTSQCKALLNTAQRIKETEQWEPKTPANRLQKPDQVNHQAAKVAPSIPSSTTDVKKKSVAPKTTPASSPSLLKKVLNRDSPTASPQSRIRQLTEPISSRKLTTTEQKILLKAGNHHLYKFPQWDKSPSSHEFVLKDGTQPFTEPFDLSLSTYQQQFFSGWVRAPEALPPPSMFPSSRDDLGPLMATPDSIDLVQDAATDCSVVASLCAAIARAERGHDQMLPNMISPYDVNLQEPVLSPNGKYIVRLNFNGCWRKVVIDDRLPVSKTHRLLHVIDRKNPALLWPALLEKAYLKVRGGYDFPGSNSCSDLWTLTGWIPEQIYLQEPDTVPTRLWKRIYNAFLYGDVLITVGTGRMSAKQERELGLEGQHSYVVLDMKEIENDNLLLVKNPWVEGKGWRGSRPFTAPIDSNTISEESPEMRMSGVKQDNTVLGAQSTTFWIPLNHVIQHFESLYLNWNPGLFQYRQDIHFEWDIVNQHVADGCLVTHPQFFFSAKEGGIVWLLLNRHFRSLPEEDHDQSDALKDSATRSREPIGSPGELSKGYMSIFVCNSKGKRLYIKDTYLERGPYVNTPQSLLRWDSKPNSTYTVVIDQDELPTSNYTFTLSAFSNTAISLEHAIDHYPFQHLESSEWTRQTAGGSFGTPGYYSNPQFTLEVKERCDLAIVLTSSTLSDPMHVKLTFGHGKRIYKLNSRDVLANSGDHRSGCVFAEKRDLQPGMYTIICSLFEAGKMGNFTLRVHSTGAIVLGKIPRDGAGLILQTLPQAVFSVGTNKIAAPLVAHRLASYTIVARFSRAKRAQLDLMSMVARSPLRVSLELGRGPERKFFITSENGSFSDSAVVRTESTSIEPEIIWEARQECLWLVLERLSSPGDPAEEWYEVDVYTDQTRACSIGVWRNWDN